MQPAAMNCVFVAACCALGSYFGTVEACVTNVPETIMQAKHLLY